MFTHMIHIKHNDYSIQAMKTKLGTELPCSWDWLNVLQPENVISDHFFQLWSASLLINVLLTSALPHMAGTNYF